MHGIQVRGLGDEQGRAFFFALFEILSACFNCCHFWISIRGVRLGFDQADMVKVPGHGARRTQLPLAERHADFSHGAVDVIGQALNDQRHLMRGETFVGHAGVLHGFSADTGTLVDRPLDGVSRHGRLFGLFVHQAQVRVHVRVGAVTGCNGQLFGQLAENLAAAIGGFRFVFNLPLCAHFSLSQSCVSRHAGRRMGASLYAQNASIDQKIQSRPAQPLSTPPFTDGTRPLSKAITLTLGTMAPVP